MQLAKNKSDNNGKMAMLTNFCNQDKHVQSALFTYTTYGVGGAMKHKTSGFIYLIDSIY